MYKNKVGKMGQVDKFLFETNFAHGPTPEFLKRKGAPPPPPKEIQELRDER